MIKYEVNEEQKLIKARIVGCKYDAIKQILKRYPAFDFKKDTIFSYCKKTNQMELAKSSTGAPVFGLDKAIMADEYVAHAKCLEGDTFDVELGKKLAKQKVIRHYNRGKKSAIDKWVRYEFKLLRNNILNISNVN